MVVDLIVTKDMVFDGNAEFGNVSQKLGEHHKIIVHGNIKVHGNLYMDEIEVEGSLKVDGTITAQGKVEAGTVRVKDLKVKEVEAYKLNENNTREKKVSGSIDANHIECNMLICNKLIYENHFSYKKSLHTPAFVIGTFPPFNDEEEWEDEYGNIYNYKSFYFHQNDFNEERGLRIWKRK